MKTKITLTISVILMATLFATAQTIIPAGAVEGTWTLSASPYEIQGAIYVANSTTLTIEPGVVVQFNTTERFEIDGCLLAEGTEQDSILFTNYDPQVRWGSIKWLDTPISNDSSKIAYCIFEYGYAYGEEPSGNSGGAIGVKNFDKLSIQHSTFHDNLVTQVGDPPQSGAAIALWNSSIYISHCIFHNNEARYGGAIIYTYGSNAITDNCLFYDNTAISHGGAIEVYENSYPYLINCTFADNHANSGGGAIDITSGLPNLINCILWGNTSNAGKNQVHIRTSGTGINIYHCDIEKGEAGFSGFTNNGTTVNILDTEPEFIGSGDFPYDIEGTSPCVNEGTLVSLYLPEGWVCPYLDLADSLRLLNEVIDIGAYETSLITGTNEYQSIQILNLSVYPNPASNNINLSYQLKESNPVSINLYSVTGQKSELIPTQMTPAGTHQYQIDLSGFPNGYYLLKLQAGNKVVTRKVVKH